MILEEYFDVLRSHGIFISSDVAMAEFNHEIQTDNRMIKAGDAFVCIKGFNTDGHRFIDDAIGKGASLIIHEEDLKLDISSIRVTDSRKAAALAVNMRFENPSSKFILIGVTGTNGKTTVTHLLFNALKTLGYKCGLIGTLGYTIDEDHYETAHTTPDIVELNQIFLKMNQRGVTHVVMEVSSHALALERVYGIGFNYCLFTNISRDHLDFHKDMQEYSDAKFRLFKDNPGCVSLINTDDTYGLDFYNRLYPNGNSVYSISENRGDFIIQDTEYNIDHSRFSLVCNLMIHHIKTPLIGHFNIHNVAIAASLMMLMGIKEQEVIELIPSLTAPAGRLEALENSRGIGVFVDYAHTPEAIENVLKALASLPHNRILCLFGAGGDRDTGKRPMMLKIAMQHSDAVIISDDNPRSESPCKIVSDIIQDTSIWLPWWIIRDRKEAIHSILRLACPGDIVVICGKGHETYQEIKGVRHHFDDRDVAREYLKNVDVLTPSNDNGELILPIDPLLLNILFDNQFKTPDEYQTRFYRKISLDSRSITSGSLYIAVKGERYDGHDYISDVLGDPDNASIGEEPFASQNYGVVGNSLLSLGMICRKYLLMFSPYKIGITGSTGKTTCKEMLYNILSRVAPTLKSERNENNIIGLCKTIMNIRPEHRYAVLELGTNHFGEIASLSDICFPDCGIILNIGPSHLEFFGDEDGVFIEKSSLFERPLNQKLYPADDSRFDKYIHQGVSIGFSETADYRIHDVVCSNGTCQFRLNENQYSISSDIPYFAYNAAFAIVVGLVQGVNPSAIKEALQSPLPDSHRMQIEDVSDQRLIIDCYNANPVSMLKAIEYWCAATPDRPHIAILGDMLELGQDSIMYHQMIGAALRDMSCDFLITVGDNSIYYHPDGTDLDQVHFSNVDNLIVSNRINGIPSNALILIKGSHGIHLEKLLPVLRKGGV